MTVTEAVALWRVAPFARGSADCCAFADFVVHHLTGQHYLPTYSSDAEAEAIKAEHGGLSGAVTHSMQRQPVPREDLEPGDVALIKVGDLEAVGIVMGRRVATIFENGYCGDLPIRTVQHGWKLWA